MSAAVAEKTNTGINEFINYLVGELFNEFLYAKEVEEFVEKQLKYKESIHEVENLLKRVFKNEVFCSSRDINELAKNYRQLLFAEVICFYVDYFDIKGGKHLTIEDIIKINKLIKKELSNL